MLLVKPRICYEYNLEYAIVYIHMYVYIYIYIYIYMCLYIVLPRVFYQYRDVVDGHQNDLEERLFPPRVVRLERDLNHLRKRRKWFQ